MIKNNSIFQKKIMGLYPSYVTILSHFKGHGMAGFGGAIKNTSIGIASAPEGKMNIHSGGRTKTEFLDENAEYMTGSSSADRDLTYDFQLAMAEATLSVSDALNGGDNIIYINVMYNNSIDCDCNPQPVKPDIHDVGILASTDPVALDDACLEIASLMDESGTLLLRTAQRLGIVSLIHGEEIGLGSRYYYLVDIDE